MTDAGTPGGPRIATVRYKLPPPIDEAACREHFHRIPPGFQQVGGLISKHFIRSESAWTGGVSQVETIEAPVLRPSAT